MGFHTAEGIRGDILGETIEDPKVPLIPKKTLARSYVEWFCFLTGLLRVSLNVSFYILINIYNMTVDLIVMTDIRPNPYLFQDTTKKSCGVSRPLLSWIG